MIVKKLLKRAIQKELQKFPKGEFIYSVGFGVVFKVEEVDTNFYLNRAKTNYTRKIVLREFVKDSKGRFKARKSTMSFGVNLIDVKTGELRINEFERGLRPISIEEAEVLCWETDKE